MNGKRNNLFVTVNLGSGFIRNTISGSVSNYIDPLLLYTVYTVGIGIFYFSNHDTHM